MNNNVLSEFFAHEKLGCGKAYYINRYVKAKMCPLAILIIYVTFSYKTKTFAPKTSIFE